MGFNIGNRRYLGSKARLLNFISEVVKENCDNINTFADIFAGTGNVAFRFNNLNTKVIVNDILKSNFYTYEAFFGGEEIDIDKIRKLIDKYNSLESSEADYFTANFADTFFSKHNCMRIDYIRNDIEKQYLDNIVNSREKAYLITSLLYSMDRIANTVGHYDAFRAHGDLNKELRLELLDLLPNEVNKDNECYSMNANDLVKEIKADIVYIDPPYNSRQYCDAYHLLENVAVWNKPKVFGTARKMDRSNLKSKYCMRSAPKEFDDLIQNINARYILVSYNNMGNKGAGRSQAKISDEDIINSLSKRGKIKIFETDFQQFTTGKSNIEDHKERLFLCFVGEKSTVSKVDNDVNDGLIKSPLNYTGGKYKLLPQLIEKFPSKIGTFVDLFGGGFNVGANIKADSIVYNDKSKDLSKIVKLFCKHSSFEIIDEIDQIIEKYNLSKTFINGYEYYNCDSESGVGKYNKPYYEKLRTDYNVYEKDDDYKYIMLLTLIIFAFNNQIRFNSKGEYNMPVGKRDFNSRVRRNLKEFVNRMNSLDVKIQHKEFDKINIINLKDPFVYCDPPYYLGNASYNESNGWTEKDEDRLLNYLNILNENNIKFALSNVIEHKGMVHTKLKEWIEDNHYNLIYIKSNYSNSNYHLKNKDAVTREVLITNY